QDHMQQMMDQENKDLGGFNSDPYGRHQAVPTPEQPVVPDSTDGSDGAMAPGPARGAVLNWRVTVTNFTVADQSDASLGALWKYTDANLRLAGGTKPANCGLRLGLAGDHFAAELDAQVDQAGRAKASTKAVSMLVVAQGGTGLITVGGTRFVPAFVLDGHAMGGQLLQAEAVQELIVRPDSEPDGSVQLSLTPAFGRLANSGDVVLSEMTTAVRLKPGQDLVIGELDGAQNLIGGSLFEHNHGSRNSRTILTVRVDPM
ncbi:MAG: hypothetical protein ACREJ2_07410, partial [Planctomycetota bacterium]